MFPDTSSHHLGIDMRRTGTQRQQVLMFRHRSLGPVRPEKLAQLSLQLCHTIPYYGRQLSLCSAQGHLGQVQTQRGMASLCTPLLKAWLQAPLVFILSLLLALRTANAGPDHSQLSEGTMGVCEPKAPPGNRPGDSAMGAPNIRPY